MNELEKIKVYLKRIENRYNPESDVPDGPQVTYTDYQLLEACKALAGEVERLTARLDAIDTHLEHRG